MPITVCNDSPFRVGFLPARLSYPDHDVVVVMKGTFRFEHGAAARAVGRDEQLHLSGDISGGDERDASVFYPSDFAPFKPSADVMLVGTCHTPGGAPRERMPAGMEVGSVKKRVDVIGDRAWVQGPDGIAVAGRPQAFTTMPIRWEHAFGGPGFAENPAGAGLSTKLPNLEDPSRPLRVRGERPAPVGLGPVDRRRPSRTRHAGTYDDRWKNERWPHFPSDFDYAYFNAAPEDQRVPGYLRGDEALSLVGVDPDRELLETRLPGLRARCILRRVDGSIEDLAMRLDTLWIDADDKRLVVVFRGFTRAANKALDDIATLFVAAEPCAVAPSPARSVVARLEGTSGAGASPDGALFDPTPEHELPRAAAEHEAPSDEDAASIEEAVSLLERGGAPADLVERARACRTLEAVLEVLAEVLPEAKEGFGDSELAGAQAQGRDLLASSGADAPALDEEDMPAPPATGEMGPLSRAEVERRMRDGDTLAGADLRGLDLRAIDLSNANLRRANLDDCDLEGARLAGADLTEACAHRARFDRADLRASILIDARLEDASLAAADLGRASASRVSAPRAMLSRASLEGADFASADLKEVSLDDANLRGTRLDEAVLRGATLVRVDGTRARLSNASLEGARLDGAKLDGASLRGAKLDGTSFEGAHLKEASLENAIGRDVTLRGADLSAVRGAGANLQGARLERARGVGSIWTGATLEGGRFDRAELDRADFTEARLAGASFDLAVLRYASFARAALAEAALTKVNLFRGCLEGADLRGADVRGSNLFECELLEANTVGARFEKTNLKRTKLSTEAM